MLTLKLNQNEEVDRIHIKIDKNEIIWSIPTIIILIYLIYYGINGRKITDECLNYCSTFSKLYAWKLDGDFFGAFVLDKNKMYCSCYYPNSNFPFANATIAQIERLLEVGRNPLEVSSK
jgi:hypothetical protein